jgi:bifunctional non-homologous end joining protein LigD
MNPGDKRLAIHVDDHPLNYQYFEGTIPPGHYGAGTVEIWDHGTYTIKGARFRKEIESQVKDGLQKGHLDLVLSGEKLHGRFVLQKLKKDPGDQAWLLIKVADAPA